MGFGTICYVPSDLQRNSPQDSLIEMSFGCFRSFVMLFATGDKLNHAFFVQMAAYVPYECIRLHMETIFIGAH